VGLFVCACWCVCVCVCVCWVCVRWVCVCVECGLSALQQQAAKLLGGTSIVDVMALPL
jgi:hypothetical protein